MASFQAPTTLQRLVTLAVGAGAAMLVLVATLWHPQKDVRYVCLIQAWNPIVYDSELLEKKNWGCQVAQSEERQTLEVEVWGFEPHTGHLEVEFYLPNQPYLKECQVLDYQELGTNYTNCPIQN